MIVKTGDTIGNQHISLVQKAVKEHLDDLENDTRDQIIRELDQIKMEIEQVKASADLEMEILRNQLEDQSSVSQNQNSRLRDEITRSETFHILSRKPISRIKTTLGTSFSR